MAHHKIRTSAAIISWLLQIIAAVIFLQTLFFKFSAAPESVYIFSKLGVEPYGRILAGIMELISAICLLVPRTVWFGALLGLITILGAMIAHLTVLGLVIVVNGQSDHGELFMLAVIAFVCCIVILLLRYRDIPFFNNKTNEVHLKRGKV